MTRPGHRHFCRHPQALTFIIESCLSAAVTSAQCPKVSPEGVILAQVAPGSMWEGGLRVHVELLAGSASSGSQEGPRPRRWLPLVHAPANSAAPAAVLRLPLKHAPTLGSWSPGERVEVNFHASEHALSN